MAKEVYQLKITLNNVKPEIWRRIVVDSGVDLIQLHHYIQDSMGWEHDHLFSFNVGNTFYSDLTYLDDSDMEDGRNKTLKKALPSLKARMLYEYDFGDGWVHDILLEKILTPEEAGTYPACIDGANRCPPEDCGGPWGYMNLVEVMSNPKHPEYQDMVEWLGVKKWDPAKFDVKKVKL